MSAFYIQHSGLPFIYCLLGLKDITKGLIHAPMRLCLPFAQVLFPKKFPSPAFPFTSLSTWLHPPRTPSLSKLLPLPPLPDPSSNPSSPPPNFACHPRIHPHSAIPPFGPAHPSPFRPSNQDKIMPGLFFPAPPLRRHRLPPRSFHRPKSSVCRMC